LADGALALGSRQWLKVVQTGGSSRHCAKLRTDGAARHPLTHPKSKEPAECQISRQMAHSIMKRSKLHLKHLERPRRYGKAYLIAAIVGLLNITATVTTLPAAGPLF
jgi:hypothetical protein